MPVLLSDARDGVVGSDSTSTGSNEVDAVYMPVPQMEIKNECPAEDTWSIKSTLPVELTTRVKHADCLSVCPSIDLSNCLSIYQFIC